MRGRWMAGAAVVLVGFVAGCGSRTQPEQWGPASNGLRARVWLIGDEYKLGEPIRLRLAIRNESDKAQVVPRAIACFDIFDHLYFENKADSDDTRGGEGSARSKEDLVVLEPGMTYEFPFDARNLLVDPKRCEREGRYRYVLECQAWRAVGGEGNLSWSVSVSSNPVEFRVKSE